MGGMGVGHHKGIKVYKLPGEQLFGLAGDVGLCMRFKAMIESSPASAGMPAQPPVAGAAPIPPNPYPTALDYVLLISQSINQQFAATRVPNHDAAMCFVAFPFGGQAHCCAFVGGVQPFMLDQNHYYMALGVGKLSADPFLRFLVDIFCSSRRPTVREAVFLATWTVQHAIETTPGGVADPIRVGVIEAVTGGFTARELPRSEIYEHLQAVSSAQQSLRDWRDAIQSGQAAAGVPPVPQPPPAQPPAPTAPRAAAPAPAPAPAGGS